MIIVVVCLAEFNSRHRLGLLLTSHVVLRLKKTIKVNFSRWLVFKSRYKNFEGKIKLNDNIIGRSMLVIISANLWTITSSFTCLAFSYYYVYVIV